MPQSSQLEADDLDRPIWGAAAIGAEANLTPRQAFHALERGHLPGTKIGAKWMSTKRRLRALFESSAA
jgi:hypothetical protein